MGKADDLSKPSGGGTGEMLLARNAARHEMKDPVAAIVRQAASDALFNGAGKVINPEVFDDASKAIRNALASPAGAEEYERSRAMIEDFPELRDSLRASSSTPPAGEDELREEEKTILEFFDNAENADLADETWSLNATNARKALNVILEVALSPPLPSGEPLDGDGLGEIIRDLRDNYPAVDVTTAVFQDLAGVPCCVIPQDRVLAIISALERMDAGCRAGEARGSS